MPHGAHDFLLKLTTSVPVAGHPIIYRDTIFSLPAAPVKSNYRKHMSWTDIYEAPPALASSARRP
jgi:hypothetical protein